ncbi:undecaprenyl/decaprenyl-phosphate alpha-N-acetylglucosaminyl 1-phosphate transferase [Gammaproteobacteria bacterium]|nr:undecaprenyl/decaprenyl-phosphate alpha-N-acetylglucosaminyl 1-phosphate transferase [Gammaproteobacteria bacterium]
MLFSIAVTLLFLSFFASVVITGYLRNIARANNILIDIPDKSRKFHFRPTPLVGGISIHVSMLLSSIFMLFLIDYKYDFQFNGFSLLNSSEAGYSKKLTIKDADNGNIEKYRLNITEQNNTSPESTSYDVNFGNPSEESLNILQINKNIFSVSLPNGEIKIFHVTNSGIVEISSSGEEISKPYKIENDAGAYFSLSSFMAAFIIISILLQALILIDDAYGIKAWKRLLIQSTASLALVIVSDVYIEDLRISLLGIDLELGLWGIPFTVFASVGIINAFNMIDGINGLCSGFALITLSALLINSGFNVNNYGLIIAIGSIIGFLFYNLGFLGTKRRVFLGDNGSTLLGFLIAWTCINYSQSANNFIQPVTCLWIVAIPLLDCLGVIIGRAIKGIFPFSPGRDHIHHKLQELNQSSNKTLIGLLVLGSLLAGTGILIEASSLSSETSFVLFLCFATFFYIGSSKMFKKNGIPSP